jgi:hypothetical protein
VHQRQFKMPTKSSANSEKPEAEQPRQSQPETERYLQAFVYDARSSADGSIGNQISLSSLAGLWL